MIRSPCAKGRTMRAFREILVASALLAGCCTSIARAEPAQLRLAGTGSSTELLNRLAAAFQSQSGARVDVIVGLGSSGALRAMQDGAIDVAVSGRPLKPDERKGLTVALTVSTPFVFVTSKPNPSDLTVAAVVNAFQRTDAQWHDGTPIKVLLRTRSESDTLLMGQLFPGLADAIETARKRADIPIAATDQDNADLAEQIPGSLTGSTLTQILLEKRRLHVVPIDGIAPNIATLKNGAYRYRKPLFFIIGAKPSPLADRFLQFIQSSEGQQILRDAAVSM
jgi:phosphate transport system substrate-binding protein